MSHSYSGKQLINSGNETTYELGHDSMPKKRGHKCCGCCCDVRRAVIILNIVNILLLINVFVQELIGRKTAQENIANGTVPFDDDYMIASYQKIADMSVARIVSVNLLRAIISAIGIFGALHYNVYMVGITGIMYSVVAVIAFVNMFLVEKYAFMLVGTILLQGLFAYPHFVFIHEVRKGIMTPATYPEEKQSCCCV